MIASVIRSYPSYRLEDFYRKSFLQGGITTNQLFFLFKSADTEKYDYYKFLGALQGIDIEETTKDQGQNERLPTSKEEEAFLFQDPAVYEVMTAEEREAKNKEMMEHWKGFQLKTSPKQQ